MGGAVLPDVVYQQESTGRGGKPPGWCAGAYTLKGIAWMKRRYSGAAVGSLSAAEMRTGMDEARAEGLVVGRVEE